MMHIAAIFRQKCLLVIHCCGLQRIETKDSFTIAAGKAGKADKGDAWAAPALQTLYALRHMMTADHLSKLLPALLRLQGDIQVWPACLPACQPYTLLSSSACCSRLACALTCISVNTPSFYNFSNTITVVMMFKLHVQAYLRL